MRTTSGNGGPSKRLAHHQSRHLVKDRVEQPGVMRLDIAAFGPSADGCKFCLVAAATVEVDKAFKLLPIFAPMPKKAAVSGLASKEAVALCNDCNLREITESRITRVQADGGGEFNNQKLKDLCFEKSIVWSFSLAHQSSSNGIGNGERMECSKQQFGDFETSSPASTMVVICVQVYRSHDA